MRDIGFAFSHIAGVVMDYLSETELSRLLRLRVSDSFFAPRFAYRANRPFRVDSRFTYTALYL